jgi:hypothetical protein
MQMFKQPVKHISQGDRAGVCVTQLDAKARDRGVSPLALALALALAVILALALALALALTPALTLTLT